MATTQDTTTKPAAAPAAPAASQPKKLHLMSEPGFLRLYIQNLLVMTALLVAGARVPVLRELVAEAYMQLNEWMMATAHKYAWWSLLGLLASSCCALQLILNAFSMGCAGLNTVLGPLRPTLLAVTTILQTCTWGVGIATRSLQFTPKLLSTVAVVGLAVLPEVLDCYQRRKQKQRKAEQQKHLSTTTSTTIKTTTCLYRLDNIGCSSCVATVSNVLETLESVQDFEVSLEKGGSLSVTTSDQEIVKKKLEEAGFPMQSLDESKKQR